MQQISLEPRHFFFVRVVSAVWFGLFIQIHIGINFAVVFSAFIFILWIQRLLMMSYFHPFRNCMQQFRCARGHTARKNKAALALALVNICEICSATLSQCNKKTADKMYFVSLEIFTSKIVNWKSFLLSPLIMSNYRLRCTRNVCTRLHNKPTNNRQERFVQWNHDVLFIGTRDPIWHSSATN